MNLYSSDIQSKYRGVVVSVDEVTYSYDFGNDLNSNIVHPLDIFDILFLNKANKITVCKCSLF